MAKSLISLNNSQQFVIQIGLFFILYYAYIGIVNGILDITDFVTFNTYIFQIFAPLGILGYIWRMIRQQMVDVELVLNMLETNEQIPEVENPVKANITKGEIEFRNVTFTYDTKLPEGERKYILEKLSFKIPAGKKVGIVGQTGSGKSTIMRLLYRFYDIQEG